MGDPSSLFDFKDCDPDEVLGSIKGRIVITEGLSNPARTSTLEKLGALGVVVINPGDRSHWGTNSVVWGSPTPDDMALLPGIASIAVAQHARQALLGAVASGTPIHLKAEMIHGWFEQPIVTLELKADKKSANFVLLHSHYDSWEIGIGDNATGNATLIEVARALSEQTSLLKSNIRFAWWPGHSAGRYAGSTWYADQYAMDMEENCIAHVNCDSPGCRDATSYTSIRGMPEAQELVAGAVKDLFQQKAELTSPGRAGDYSFNNLGITGCMLTSSMIPEEERNRRGWYAVGGCGGDPAWHSEFDTLEIADRGVLENDTKLYTLLAFRLASSSATILDYRRTLGAIDEQLDWFVETVSPFWETANLTLLRNQARRALDRLYDTHGPGLDNHKILKIGRILVRLGFAEQPKWTQDGASAAGTVPLVEGLNFAHLSQDPAERVLARRMLNALQFQFAALISAC